MRSALRRWIRMVGIRMVGIRMVRIGLVLLAAGAAVAQAPTVPAALAGVEGGGGTNIPFGSNQACRYQVIYDREELPWTGPRVITGIMLRADNNLPNTAIPAKGFLEVSVLMSTTSRTSATMSTTFADNYGSDATWVLQNQMMQLPAQPPHPPGPRPANIPFPFTVPWAYGLTPATQGLPPPSNLLVEIWIHFQPSGSYRIDNLGSCVAPTTTVGQVGPLCAAPGNQPVELGGNVSMTAGSSYTWTVQNAPASMPFLVALNLEQGVGLLGNPAWPLPYPMFDPLSPSQPSAALASLTWPAPDCWINVDPAVWLTGVCDAAGNGAVSGPLPPGREFVGTVFWAQAYVFAPTANPLRIITSLGRTTEVCGPLGVARVYAFYNGVGTTSPPPVGSLQYGVGAIFDVY
jgi:hypothetical protein